MQQAVTEGHTEFKARALLLGERIDLRALEGTERLAANPLSLPVQGGGVAVLFRYGLVVLFDVAPIEEAAFLGHLGSYVAGPHAQPETEVINIIIDPDAREGMRGEAIVLATGSIERLQLIADILAKSVILSMYEA